ncbi:MAG TPA: TetR/AcrR family transcriptional regulator [Terriglobales bacterium]|nr:TetR/AcrR family transcriptional regulator [Terriglobales bacterium]
MQTPLSRRRADSRDGESQRYERRLGEILEHATDIFHEKGYEGASMRDLSRASGMSLAGLYYYFESKERLLFLIQKHTFETVLEQLRSRLRSLDDPQQRVRAFVENHLQYFLKNEKAMKVLSHEDEALKGDLGAQIRQLKREYFRLCLQLVEDLRHRWPQGFAPGVSSRIAVLSLFGMVNWIYTWHNPRTDGDPQALARQMSDLFLRGVLRGPLPRNGHEAGRPAKSARNKIPESRPRTRSFSNGHHHADR